MDGRATTWALEARAIDPVHQDERALVDASREGDRTAFERLIERHQVRVFRLAGRFFRRREDVEDAAQETFLRAWSNLHSYAGKAPFEHWLTRVCLNCCYGRLRQARPEVELLQDERPAPPTTPGAALDVERLLAQLKPEDRFILLLLEGEGWTTAEIAQQLGWSRVNVKVRAHRARKRLRALVDQP